MEEQTGSTEKDKDKAGSPGSRRRTGRTSVQEGNASRSQWGGLDAGKGSPSGSSVMTVSSAQARVGRL